jgi:PAS domain S-box-containing protein
VSNFLSKKFWNRSLLLIAVAAGYFVLARVSLLLSYQSSNATPVWPPSGFAFAMLLIFGYRIAPAILVGAFAANVVVFQLNNAAGLSTALWVSFLISIGNMGESLAGYYLLRKIMPDVTDNNYFKKTGHIFLFFFIAMTISLISSLVGSTSVFLGGIIEASHFSIAWITWWLGDVSGILLITPLILVWRNFFLMRKASPGIYQKQATIRVEIIALCGLTVLASGVVFDNWFFEHFMFQWAFWIIPFLVWASIRSEQHEAVTAIVLCSSIAVLGTLNGGGPFSPRNASDIALNESLLILQSFVCIIVITTLILNASVKEQKQTAAAIRELGNQLEERVTLRTAELREAAKEIEIINKRLTEAQRLAHIGNWEWDIQSNRVSWSDELFNIFGLTPQTFEASYENYLQNIHPDEREQVNKIIQDAYTTHQPYSFYHRIVRPDGRIRMLHGRGEVIVNEKNEPVSMTGTAQDVTEIKQAEEEIKQLADDLIRYNKQLEQTNKELESFTFVASHDLQEPLRKIRTFLSLIAEKEATLISDTSKDYLKRTFNAAERMQELINDLLVYSRTTGSPEHFQKTDLNKILEKVTMELKEVIEEKSARIESAPLPELNVIPFQLQQLFTNLLSNSLKFSKPGVPPQIRISTATVHTGKGDDGKKYYGLSISDNGIGFETKYNEKIFDLFQRLHSREEYSGTGIGLSICKRIAENHGGFITASSEPGKGAVFTIYLQDTMHTA